MKKCCVCKETKSLINFNKNKAQPDGYVHCCKKCENERAKRYYDQRNTRKKVEDMPGEIWVNVIGLDGYFKVSNLGRIKSVDRVIIRKGREARAFERLMAQVPCTGNYLQVCLRKEGEKGISMVHQIVIKSFKDNPDPKEFTHINHIDGDKNNNRLDNLEYCTPQYNQEHAAIHGLKSSKLNADQVMEIKKLIAGKELSNAKIGEMYEVHRQTIQEIRANRNWKHVKI